MSKAGRIAKDSNENMSLGLESDALIMVLFTCVYNIYIYICVCIKYMDVIHVEVHICV